MTVGRSQIRKGYIQYIYTLIGLILLFSYVPFHNTAFAADTDAADDISSGDWMVDEPEFKANVKLPDDGIALATPFTYTISVLPEGGSDYDMAVPFDVWEKLGITLLSPEPVLERKGDGKTSPDIWTLNMLAMHTGDIPVPGPDIEYGQGNDGGIKSFPLPLLTATVTNPLDQETEDSALKPMKEPISAKTDYGPLLRTLAYAVPIAAILTVALIMFIRYMKKRKLPTVQPREPAKPAHEIALNKLSRIREDELIEKGLYRLFYFSLSECMREYLESRFKFPALEMTTEEFFEKAAVADTLPSTCKDGVNRLLAFSDLVKFAKHEPTIDDMEDSLSYVENLIRSTIPLSENADCDSIENKETAVSST